MLQKNKYVGLINVLRNVVNTLQFKFSPRVKSALKSTDFLLASTSETKRLLHDTHSIESAHLPENAITSEMLCNQRVVEVLPDERVNLIWVGRVDERKSLDILLTALSLVKGDNWHLYVVGSGPLVDDCIKLSEQLCFSKKITWVGAVSREEVNHYYKKSHLHAITSMAEGNPTVVWEAMSFGIPTITLDHCGMHDTVCDNCGVRTPLGGIDDTVRIYSENIERLISNPELITELSRGVVECSRKYNWDQRRVDWEAFYETAINNWHIKKNRVA
jgi:glycosyltransferase involved in cell wall biosynthesis